MRWNPLLTLLILTSIAFAGCLGDDADPDAADTTSPMEENDAATDTSTGTEDAPSNSEPEGPSEGTEPGNLTRYATLESNQTAGEAPLAVAFTGSVTAENDLGPAEPGNFTWTLLFGDGSEAIGGDQETFLAENHTFTVGGNYTSLLTTTFEDGETTEANVTISVTVPVSDEGEDAEPPQTFFEYGPSLGCPGDNGPGTCVGIEVAHNSGVVQSIDGHFTPLDERYFGLTVEMHAFVGGNDLGDSDCYFLDDTFVVVGDANNGGGPCMGTVPKGASWLFSFAWVAPSGSATVEFT